MEPVRKRVLVEQNVIKTNPVVTRFLKKNTCSLDTVELI